jgi:phosphoglycerate kinase
MSISASQLLPALQAVCGANPNQETLTLQDYLSAIPRLESLSDLPKGTAVLVRGDVDAKPGPTIGEGDIRLRSMKETLNYGRQHGWKQIVFGHIGREKEKSLKKVAARLGEILGCDCPLIENWLDEATLTITPSAIAQIKAIPEGGVCMLENTRRYDIERVLWKAKPADLPGLAENLAKVASELADQVASVYVNEALSAGSLDASTTAIPAAMKRVALGKYVAGEFDGPMARCLGTQLVVFSGLKTDKLDDLQAMIDRGTVKMVFTAGSLAMALKAAAAQLDGGKFSLGIAEDPGHAEKAYYIAPARIEQAKRMIESGRAKGIEFVLPVDFVLQDGRVSEIIGPADQQLDVGPKTSEHFAQKITQFIAKKSTGPAVAFYNGVFGMFEDPRFEMGTKRFIGELKRMKDAGVEVYVGGGEGGAALEKYGKLSDVTHCFTAGGTVLNALGSEPVPYLVALSLAAKKK